jgi:hypothetical protein
MNAKLSPEIVPYGGWQRNLRLANDSAELIVSLDVGPRIISYRVPGHDNILKNYPEEIGQAREDAWMIRGGHRLWIAPEDEKVTYHWDNEPVEHREDGDGFLTFFSRQAEPLRIAKELKIRMAPDSSKIEIQHLARNEGDEPVRIATWGLTVMESGGMQILSQPAMGSHPEDLLPNRALILWPYTDLTDPRLHLGRKFITLRQSDTMGPIKFGLAHREKWAAYLWADSLFIKSFAYEEGRTYADFGCNFETFTNETMLEIESLGPLADLGPGETTSHDETWHLFPLDEAELDSEESLGEWLAPYLDKAGLAG